MVNAIFANPNWDDEKNDRTSRIRELNDNFDQAIALVRNPDSQKEAEIDWNDPWWRAHKRNFEKTRVMYGLEPEGKTMGELVELDEARAIRGNRQSAIRELDQG
jgi:hypothetical protein